MADICEMTNRLAEAQQYLQQGERLAPDHPLSHRLAATLLRRQGRVDEALARLEAAPLPENNPLLAESIHFELGRLYERRQDSASAYAHYQQGNRLLSERPEAAGTDKHAYLNMIQTIRQTFTPEWLTTWSAPLEAIDTATPDPIFLVGFPRSGTTLLDQILSSHASLQVIEEQPLIADIRRELASTPAGYLATLADMNPDRIQQLRHHYLDNAARYLEPEKNGPFVDKLPLNIVHLGLIIRLFPNARIILALRHPCDVCLSCFMQAFAPNDAMANFYTLEDAARLYAEVMGLWHHYASLLALNYHPIKYEDIVADFEGETRRLLDFLGLEWDPRVLEYNKNARQRKHINTPSYNQVTEEIYTRARYRWQRYENQLRPVMPLLAPFIDHFNY
jgi:tetratricopeptide (TPR) repeat protein